ncbi:MAG: putative aminohydrolase SsnA [Bacillota bacterium]
MKLIGPGTVITLNQENPVVKDGGVVVEDNLVKEIGTYSDLKEKYEAEVDEVIDADNKLIMPGMVNNHMHLYSTFARGMALKDEPPTGFVEILDKLWWRLDKALDHESIYYSAVLAIIECIKNGTTAMLDHHASPNAIPNSLDKVAEAVKDAGIRACLSYEISDRDGKDKAKEGIAENRRFIESCQEDDSDFLAGAVGLHASFTLEDDTLEEVGQLVDELDTGVHIHVAEGEADQQDSLDKHGLTVVERLNKFGLCNSKMLASHCVHIEPKDMEILADCDANVLHNPGSNMNNSVGYAPIIDMLDKGVLVGHGTDGLTTDMFESIKVANLLHKFKQGPSAAWEEVPTITFDNNQKITEKYFDKKLGILEEGSYADLIVVDYNPTTPLNASNFYAHLLFGVSGGMVETTMVNGEVLMQDNELKVLDEEKLYQDAKPIINQVWDKF